MLRTIPLEGDDLADFSGLDRDRSERGREGDRRAAGAGQRLLRRHFQSLEVFAFGDCQLNTAYHKLFRHGAEVSLTPKEFRLLDFFVEIPAEPSLGTES